MTDRLPNVDNLCTNPDNHKMHICELQKAGKKEQIDMLQQNPEFVCGNCGQKTNSEGSVCAPGPLQP